MCKQRYDWDKFPLHVAVAISIIFSPLLLVYAVTVTIAELIRICWTLPRMRWPVCYKCANSAEFYRLIYKQPSGIYKCVGCHKEFEVKRLT